MSDKVLSNEQERFWAGDFGDSYVDRNSDVHQIANNIALFSNVLRNAPGVQSIIEFGPNIGLNLLALKALLPTAAMTGVEINAKAAKQLSMIPGVKSVNSSILQYNPNKKFDLVLVKGVLIHICPNDLEHVYEVLDESSERYICLVEYYSRSPVELSYRGHERKLWKRDFAGEFLDAYERYRLIDYGFVYHRDAVFPKDDVNWFLLEKS